SVYDEEVQTFVAAQAAYDHGIGSYLPGIDLLQWTPLQQIDTGQVRTYSMVVGRLSSDERLHLFIVDTSDQIWTTWQQNSNYGDGWSPLSPFQTTQPGARFITAGRLSDGRFQLFVVDNANQIWTAWQQTNDANAE